MKITRVRLSQDMPADGETLTTEVLPTVSISDATVTEPNSGSAAAVFTVSLSAAFTRDVTVNYSTANDLALAGSDYTAATGQLVIAAGSTSASFSIAVLGDTSFEPREVFAVRLQSPVNAVIGRGTAFGIIDDNDKPLSLDVPTDTHFAWQWSLFSRYGINVLPAWRDYTGEGIRVAIFDQGVDASHPDLDRNLLASLGRDAATLSGTGLPRTTSDNHGTALAGVIAGERNGSGVVGVAYDADLVSIYSPLNESTSIFGLRVANAFAYARAAQADIVNDSWGFGNYFQFGPSYAFVDDFGTAAFAAAGQELRNLAASGRGGLGTVVVQSAGNSYVYGDDTNLHSFQNSRYVVTVAGNDYFGDAAYYSTPGASILVTAPGGEPGGATGLVTTDRLGATGYSTTDYVFVAGTSFSSAVASGVVALMLDANPGLGYRDVQEILAYTAVRVGNAATEWTSNGAGNWNGGGLHYNTGEHRFGFGLIDVAAAVRLAETWESAHTLANLEELTVNTTAQSAIPDQDFAGVTSAAVVSDRLEVERVDVTLNVTHTFIGDLTVELRSPSGLSSVLLSRPGVSSGAPDGSTQRDIHFTFDTVAYWGEEARGTWTLRVIDEGRFGTGTLDSWTLTIAGKPLSRDDVYVYTNEYADAFREDAMRGSLVDADGSDTLNAAAVTAASTIDLAPGAQGTVGGTPLAMGVDTVIEHAIGGDANDTIRGNAADNVLRGMRGDDSLVGRDGNDLLAGGTGNDALDGGAGVDTAVFAAQRAEANIVRTTSGFTITDRIAGREGSDDLRGIERLQFSDVNIAFDLGVGEAAGNAVRVIGAAFDVPHIRTYAGLGIDLFDAGYSMLQVAEQALNAGLFLSLAGSRGNAEFVNTVYWNVMGELPSSEARDFYVGLLQGTGGTMSQAELLVIAANTSVNEVNVALVGLQQNGLEFI